MQRLIAYVGGVVAFSIFALLAWGVTAFLRPADDGGMVLSLVEQREQRLEEHLREQDSKVASSAWVDEEQGIVRIPVEASFDIVLPKLKNKPVQASKVPLPGSEAAQRMMRAAASAPSPVPVESDGETDPDAGEGEPEQ